MDKTKLIKALQGYFKEPSTDYAVMVTGEWGVGKTYFLRDDVYKIIKEQEFRPIYVSLFGINDVAQLEKLIFQKINPFYKSPSRSIIGRKTDFIESIINNTEKPEFSVPDKIVLCFDDLERIKPDFFDKAIGFINVFIEHFKTKCIFLCNEDELFNSKNFPSYKTNKEKYIRYNYSYTSILKEVLNEYISKVKNEIHRNYYDNAIIVEMFKRGKSHNLRTLFFTLSIFKQCFHEFDKLSGDISEKSNIIKFVLTYCCFYAIETKKGTKHELLDKITIFRKQQIFIPNLKDLSKDYSINQENDRTDQNKQDEENAKLESIQQSYFVDESINFERFESVAELIKAGFFDPVLFKNDVEKLGSVLKKRERNRNESQIVNLLDDIFKYSDIELHQKIEFIVTEAEKGEISLGGYLNLYQKLIWLDSLGIKGVDINERITRRFKVGVNNAFHSGRLEYIPNLGFQFQWSINDKSIYAKKYAQFVEFVSEINENLINNRASFNFKEVLIAITQNLDNDFMKLLSSETNLSLTKRNAAEINSALIQSKAITIQKFTSALNSRYKNNGKVISQLPAIEKDFILALFALLIKNKKLNYKTKKSLNEVALTILMQTLAQIIEYHFPEFKRIKHEE